MPRIDRRLFEGPALSLGSQVVGLVQVVALLFRYGATNATDTYFYLFNLSLLPTQILTTGVMAPLMLSNERLTRAAAIRFGHLVPLVSIAAVAAGSGWLALAGRVTPGLVPAIVLSGLNATLQAMVWHRATAAQSGGVPNWVSAVALPANLLATLVLLVPWGSSQASVTAMMAALVVGNGVFLAVMARQRVGQMVIDGLPASRATRGRGHWWFLTKSATGYGGLMVLQSLAVFLPASSLTLLSLAIKIVGSASSTFVNAVMPALVHQRTESPAAGQRFLRLLAVLLGGAGAVEVLVAALLAPQYVLPALVLALWLLASAAAAVAQRLAFRFLPPSASRITILAVPVVVVAAVASSRDPGFDLVVLLCAYAGVDAATSTLLLASLRDRLMAALLGAATAALVIVWVLSL